MLKYHVCLRAPWETNWPNWPDHELGKDMELPTLGHQPIISVPPCFRCAAAPASQVLNMSEIFRGEEHFLGNLYHC